MKAVNQNKLTEAREHVKAAEKALKTSLLKWKPDFDIAADEYSQAAQCYLIGRDLPSSKNCHMQASDYYQRNKSFFHAAKALEKALLAVKEISTPDEIAGLAKESASLYQQHGSGDAAANVLDKAARCIEEKCPDQALVLYRLAADASQAESGQHNAAEYLAKCSKLLVRLKMYEEALDGLRLEMGHLLEGGNRGAAGRLTLVIVLVQLVRADAVAAEKAYKVIEQLLEAYDAEDGQGLQRALNNPFIRHMDVEYARLATLVSIPDSFNPRARSTGGESHGALAGTPPGPLPSTPDGAGGLC